MGGISVAGLMKSSLYSKTKDKVDAKAKEMMEASKACNIDVEKFDSVVFGTDGKDNVAVVISGAGLGVADNLTCISDKVKEKNDGKAPFTIEGKELKMADDNGTGYIINDTTVVFSSKGWASAVKELTEGKGKSAMDGANKAVFAKADKSKTIWFAGKAPEGMLPPQAEGLESGNGSIDLSKGLAVNVVATFNDAAKATALQDMAKGALAASKAMITAQGVPESVIDGLKIEAKDKDLSVVVSVSQADVDAIFEKLGPMLDSM
jgi:hypothetical protein